jgi:CheY-like chemotaxis protein/two-component sensor histidine kinase
MMERQLNHLVRLVDDLLEVSRITRGKIELRRERVEVDALARTAVEASRPLIDAARHELSIETPAEPLTVEADPVRLAQVLANLLNNAAKYTDPGGRIRLSVRRSGDGVLISVRDTGTGISAEMLPRVFDLFTQVDHSSVRAQGGLGIGLTLAKSLVEMHGGTLEAHSDGPGKGSEFVVRLPLAAAREPAGELEPSERSAGVLAPLRLLVVDDNRDAADSLAVLLELLGAEVHLAYSGADALRAVEACRPDVVLLDIGMPEMDGYEVARRIRARTGPGGPTLIALSGWGHDEYLRRTQEAGFDHHVIKPADLDALKALLTSLGSPRESHSAGP